MLLEDNYLAHHGIKGQRWGIRRFQNEDGSLTPEGRKRYGYGEAVIKRLKTAAEDHKQAKIAKKSKIADNGELTEAGKKELAEMAKNPGVYREQLQKHPLIKEAAKNAEPAYENYKKLDKERDKELDAFYNNDKLYEKYLNKAVDLAMKEDWSKDWGGREAVYDWYKYDDGDQGPNSSLELYKRSPEGKKLLAAEKASDEAYKVFSKACKDHISKAIGEYGNQEAGYPNSNYKTNVLSQLTWQAQMQVEKEAKASGLRITGAQKNGFLQKIRDNWEKSVYPPEMVGKSKEEKKAWEEAEMKKFDRSTEVYNADRKVAKAIKSFDKLTPEEQKDLGDKVLKSISAQTKRLKEMKESDYDLYLENKAYNIGPMERWLSDRISRKSGKETSGPVTEANRVANEKYNQNSDKMYKRHMEIRKEIGFDESKTIGPGVTKTGSKAANEREKEIKRLKDALNADKVYNALKKEHSKLSNDWCSVVLKDIGLRDTPENRAIIWPYITEMWD